MPPKFLVSGRKAGAFRPVDTLHEPGSGGRDRKYGRASPANSRHSAFFQAQNRCNGPSLPPNPYETSSKPNGKRASSTPNGTSKRRKTNQDQVNIISDSGSSEDELQREIGSKAKTMSPQRTCFDGHEHSFRNMDKMMDPSSTQWVHHQESKPRRYEQVSSLEKDELQDSSQVSEKFYARKPVANGNGAPTTFRSDTEDETVVTESATPESSVLNAPNGFDAEQNTSSPSLGDASMADAAEIKHELGDPGAENKFKQESSQKLSDSPEVPDSQPSEPHNTLEQASEAFEASSSKDTNLSNADTKHELDGTSSRDGDEASKAAAKTNSVLQPKRLNKRSKDSQPKDFKSMKLKNFFTKGKDHPAAIQVSQAATWYDIKTGDGITLFQLDLNEYDSIHCADEADIGVIVKVQNMFDKTFLVFENTHDYKEFEKKFRMTLLPKQKLKIKLLQGRDLRKEYDSRFPIRNRLTRSQSTKSTQDSHFPPTAPSAQLGPYTKLYQARTKNSKGIWKKPIEYPISDPRRATVEFKEINYLKENEWLNDNLVWFGIKYVLEHNPKYKERIYCFNTYFYPTLTNMNQTNPSKDKPKLRINYEAVKRWTVKAGIDVFKFDHIIVPINYDLHWFVAIIANVRNIKLEPIEAIKEEEPKAVGESDSKSPVTTHNSSEETSIEARTSQLHIGSPGPDMENVHPIRQATDDSHTTPSSTDMAKPTIITLDSMGHPQQAVTRNLEAYLKCEAEARHGSTISEKVKGIKGMGIPLQENGCDCGLFLIKFVERFLEDPETFVSKIVSRQMHSDYWSNTFPREFRNDFRELVLREGYIQNGILLPSDESGVNTKDSSDHIVIKPEPGLDFTPANTFTSHVFQKAANHTNVLDPAKQQTTKDQSFDNSTTNIRKIGPMFNTRKPSPEEPRRPVTRGKGA